MKVRLAGKLFSWFALILNYFSCIYRISITSYLICLFLFFSNSRCYAQNNQKIEIKEFNCHHCNKEEIRKIINKYVDVDSARAAVESYFHPSMGDRLVLVCPTCPKHHRTAIIYQSSFASKSYIKIMSAKGAGNINSSSDLKNILSGSVAVADTLTINYGRFIDSNRFNDANFRIGYIFKGHQYTRPFKVKTLGNEVYITRESLFGNQLNKSITDTVSLTVYTTNADGMTILSQPGLHLIFLSADEKQQLIQLCQLVRAALSQPGFEETMNELIPYLESRYNKVYLPSFQSLIETNE